MDEKENTLLAEEETLKSVQGSEYAVNSAIEEKKSESYRKIPHGKATDAISFMIGQQPDITNINGEGTLKAGEATLKICFNELKRGVAISTHKLLLEAIRRFAKDNHTGAGKAGIRCRAVDIPLKEYASMCGYDVTEHPKSTDKEAKEETERVENTLREVRKKVREDLKILYEASLSWKEKLKGEPADFLDLHILEGKGIRKGFIKIIFTGSFAEYLLKLPLSQYPEALWKMDERNPNAYIIGLRMAEHFSVNNNQIKKTAQLLKVRTLLGYTALPTIEEVRRKRYNWEKRIKRPFERALDVLKKSGVLEDWKYSHHKGVLMENEETNFAIYEDWEKTLIHFVLKDAPDYTERIQNLKGSETGTADAPSDTEKLKAIEEEKKVEPIDPRRTCKKGTKQKEV